MQEPAWTSSRQVANTLDSRCTFAPCHIIQHKQYICTFLPSFTTLQASKSSSTISGLREQAAQLQAALTAQTKETAAAAQLAKGHQQKMGLNMADLTSQLESERCRCAEAVADHKAAQADLADQVAYASGTTQQLKTQDAELASQV